jgi:DNA-directed RNA polymerase II subunit RPB11
LRARLLSTPHVLFAGYRVPHPLFHNFELRVQTDGAVTPSEAIITCCTDIMRDLNTMQREWTKEMELHRMVKDGANNGERGNGGGENAPW